MQALEIKDLKKVYKKPFSKKCLYALRGISFSVPQGSIFGLIGPNGAGKTTTIKSIINLVRPTSGTVLIFGRNYGEKEARREIGYMPETEKYPAYLTGRQFTDVLFKLSGGEKNNYSNNLNKWVEITGLSKAIDKNISEYSRGMRKKLGLIQAVLHEPKLLLLDEPIEGLDAFGKKKVMDALAEYREAGGAILINSHYLSEVERFCDRVAIINQGEIVMELDPKNTQTTSGFSLGVSVKESNLIESLTSAFPVKIENSGLLFLESDNELLLNKLILHLCNNGVLINRIEKAGKTLEDVYVSAIQDHKIS